MRLTRWSAPVAVTAALLSCAPVVTARSAHPVTAHADREVAAPVLTSPAAELRATLGRLLAEHAFLTTEAMRTGVAGGDDFAAAAEAVEANTVALESAIGDIYGAEAGAQFGEIWRTHVAYIVDYTRALSENDTAGQQRAVDQLEEYQTEISRFLAGATRLTEQAVSGLIEDHLAQLEQVAAFGEEDYAEAYPALREVYAHMFTIGDGLASAIAGQFPDRFTGTSLAASPALDLRLTLERLMGEHWYLAGLSTRAGLQSAQDADEAMNALSANSAELTAAIGSIYGADAGEAFDTLWRTHIDFYLAYVEATRDGDDERKQEALDGLGEYRSEFSAFLSGANPHLSAQQLQRLLGEHTGHLVSHVDAYDAGEFDRAYRISREAFAHMGTIGEGLAAAIATQFPERFPNAAIADTTPRALDVSGRMALAGWTMLALALWAARRQTLGGSSDGGSSAGDWSSARLLRGRLRGG